MLLELAMLFEDGELPLTPPPLSSAYFSELPSVFLTIGFMRTGGRSGRTLIGARTLFTLTGGRSALMRMTGRFRFPLFSEEVEVEVEDELEPEPELE